MEYFGILVALLCLTFIVQKTAGLKIYQSWKHLILTNFCFLVVGGLWDNFAIYRGHWIFPEDQILGLKIGLAPIEEYLFILVVPYLVLTIFLLVSRKFSIPR